MSQKWSYSAAGNFAGTFRFSSSSSASSSTAQGSNLSGYVSGARRAEQVSSGPEGTTVRTLSQNLGERPVTQVRRFDHSGREIENGTAANTNRRVEDVTNTEAVEGEKKD